MAETTGKRVKVTLPRAKGSEAKELWVAVNGVEYLIPKGKQVEIPDFVAEEIQRADAAAAFQDEEKDRMLEAGKKPANM